MLFPAIIFTAFNHGTMAANGTGYSDRHRHRLRHRHPLDARRPGPRVAQDIPHGAGYRRRPRSHSGHRALLRRAGADRMSAGGAGHHARRLLHEGDGREAHVLLSGAGRGGVGAVLLFGRPLDHFGRGDGHADSDDATLQQRVFRAQDAPSEGADAAGRRHFGRRFPPTKTTGSTCAACVISRPTGWA